MSSILILAGIIFLIVISGLILAFAYAVYRVDSGRWKEASKLSGSASIVLAGSVKADRNGLSDPRVVKGKVFEKALSKWQPQGKLSDEYLKNMVG